MTMYNVSIFLKDTLPHDSQPYSNVKDTLPHDSQPYSNEAWRQEIKILLFTAIGDAGLFRRKLASLINTDVFLCRICKSTSVATSPSSENIAPRYTYVER